MKTSVKIESFQQINKMVTSYDFRVMGCEWCITGSDILAS